MQTIGTRMVADAAVPVCRIAGELAKCDNTAVMALLHHYRIVPMSDLCQAASDQIATLIDTSRPARPDAPPANLRVEVDVTRGS